MDCQAGFSANQSDVDPHTHCTEHHNFLTASSTDTAAKNSPDALPETLTTYPLKLAVNPGQHLPLIDAERGTSIHDLDNFFQPFIPADHPSSPQRCIFLTYDTSRAEDCGSRLQVWKEGEIIPTRTLAHQNFAHWIDSLYSRPELKQYLDRPPTPCAISGDRMEEVWDSTILRSVQGPDGQNFIDKPNPDNEGRLIFGLNMDGRL